eukprot:612696-Prymnesium_polylepis.1
MTLRGLTGSRPVPSMWCADPSAPVSRRRFVRVSAGRRRGAERAGAPVRPARAPGRARGRPVPVARADRGACGCGPRGPPRGGE